MRYSEYTRKIAGQGAEAWDIHNRALDMAADGRDVIVLSMGDPDFDTPPAIIQSAINHLHAGKTHYTSFTGEFALRDVIAQQHNAHHHCDVSADNVVILAGAQCALYCAMHCIVDGGDEVIVPEPAYVTYEAVIAANGAVMVNVPMSPQEGFRINPERIRQAVSDNTRAILLNSPHNPSGFVMDLADLQAIAEIAIEHNLWVISDEVYASLVFEQPHHSIASIDGMQERTIVVNSLSKSHAMSGWRIGWVVGPPELSKHLANMSTCMLYGCPPFSQLAAVTALTETIPELEAMKAQYRARRDFVYQYLNGVSGLVCHLPAGGMFMMVDVRATGLSGEAFAAGLLDDYGVSVLAGEAFGPSSAGHIRIGFVVKQPQLKQACERIRQCVEKIMR